LVVLGEKEIHQKIARYIPMQKYLFKSETKKRNSVFSIVHIMQNPEKSTLKTQYHEMFCLERATTCP
jgi:hypothetical protein